MLPGARSCEARLSSRSARAAVRATRPAALEAPASRGLAGCALLVGLAGRRLGAAARAHRRLAADRRRHRLGRRERAGLDVGVEQRVLRDRHARLAPLAVLGFTLLE